MSRRSQLAELGRTRGQNADEVLRTALRAMHRIERREAAAYEARVNRHDPVDLAEVLPVQAEMAALHAPED